MQAKLIKFIKEPKTVLVILLIGALGLFLLTSDILGSLWISVLFAYLLGGFVRLLEGMGLNFKASAIIVYLAFLSMFIIGFFLLFPIVLSQLSSMIAALPELGNKIQDLLDRFGSTKIGHMINVSAIINTIVSSLNAKSAHILSASLASISSIFSFVIYVSLIPVLVFLLLYGQPELAASISKFIPNKYKIIKEVYHKIDFQLNNYVRGKFIECCIAFAAAYAVFIFFGLNYSVLLSVLTGFAVIIPFIGATVSAIAVSLVAYMQWGLVLNPLLGLAISYGLLLFIDGYILVPILFSEVVNLDPLTIIIAVIFFGGIWGIWGALFAIPMATLCKAIVSALCAKNKKN